jgi:hypothetical protein
LICSRNESIARFPFGFGLDGSGEGDLNVELMDWEDISDREMIKIM